MCRAIIGGAPGGFGYGFAPDEQRYVEFYRDLQGEGAASCVAVPAGVSNALQRLFRYPINKISVGGEHDMVDIELLECIL